MMSVGIFLLFLLSLLCDTSLARDIAAQNKPTHLAKAKGISAQNKPTHLAKAKGISAQNKPTHLAKAKGISAQNKPTPLANPPSLKHEKSLAKSNASLQKTSAVSRNDDFVLSEGQTLLQKMNAQLKEGNWSEFSAKELLNSIKEFVCKFVKKDKKTEKNEFETKQIFELCDGKINESSDNENLKKFDENLTKTMDRMKETEKSTVKVTVDGMYGTLAEILAKAKEHPKSVKLQIYVQTLEMLHLIGVKMEQGPAKDAIEKVIHKNTVAKGKNTVPIMPSELLGLAKEIWTDFLQNIGKVKQNKDNSKTKSEPKKQNKSAALPSDQKQQTQKSNAKDRRRHRRQPNDSTPNFFILFAEIFAILLVASIALKSENDPWVTVLIVAITSITMLGFNYQSERNNKNVAAVLGNNFYPHNPMPYNPTYQTTHIPVSHIPAMSYNPAHYTPSEHIPVPRNPTQQHPGQPNPVSSNPANHTTTQGYPGRSVPATPARQVHQSPVQSPSNQGHGSGASASQHNSNENGNDGLLSRRTHGSPRTLASHGTSSRSGRSLRSETSSSDISRKNRCTECNLHGNSSSGSTSEPSVVVGCENDGEISGECCDDAGDEESEECCGELDDEAEEENEKCSDEDNDEDEEENEKCSDEDNDEDEEENEKCSDEDNDEDEEENEKEKEDDDDDDEDTKKSLYEAKP